MPYLRRPDARIYYEVDDHTDPWTQPDTLFFHHGHGRSAKFWYPLVPLLSRHYRVVRIDARGCGRSTVMPADYPWTAHVFIEDARALMAKLGVVRPVWVSEFLGNIVGLAYALEYPNDLKALVQLHPICSHADVGDVPHTKGEDSGEMRRLIEAQGMRAWVRSTMWQRLDLDRASPGLVEWFVDQLGRASPITSMSLRKRVGDWTETVTQGLPQIEIPALLLLADRSPNSTPYQAEYMARTMPRAELRTLTDVGNAMWLLEPEWCAGQIRDFLARLDRPQA